jgi:hypothetical protein
MRFQNKSPQQHFEGITTKERVHSQPCGKRSRSIHNFTFVSSDFAFAGCMEEALLLANTGCSSRGREIKEKEKKRKSIASESNLEQLLLMADKRNSIS